MPQFETNLNSGPGVWRVCGSSHSRLVLTAQLTPVLPFLLKVLLRQHKLSLEVHMSYVRRSGIAQEHKVLPRVAPHDL